MKKLTLAAALLMASTTAYAGNSISFEIDGQKIHIEAPKNCGQLSCIQITAPGLSKSSFNLKNLNLKNSGDDDDVAEAAPAPKSAPALATPAVAPQAQAAIASNPQAAPTAVASTTPAPVTSYVAPVAAAPIAAAPAAPQPAPVAASPAPTTPLGIWATEEDKGNVRIEACGTNLCGYADKTGERILINMKPSDNKWVGRIHDPDSGKDYDSTIAMRGANTLKVQGCAFGGLFCGGQTWKRVG
jgi:uncharacterized protein (DUF2147 family)